MKRSFIAAGTIVLAAAIIFALVVKFSNENSETAQSNNNSTSMPAASQPGGQRQVAYWWDPMLGPSSISDHPGKSAMNMDLVPVYVDQISPGSQINIDPRIVQEMGVQTAKVIRGPINQTIRAVGILKIPETGQRDVSLKIGGWIDKLYADQTGMTIKRGDPLFTLYSPDLQIAEQELIGAVQSQKALPGDADVSLRQDSERLIHSARRKLELWDIDPREIDAIAKSDHPPRVVTFYSAASGYLMEKKIVQGSAIQPGQMLMRIADESTMWLEARVVQNQISQVHVGQKAIATGSSLAGKSLAGTITFIDPAVDAMTRTLGVRATFDNADLAMKPGMYVEADIITKPIDNALQIPFTAVIDTGVRQIVFVDEGDGHFSPRMIHTGLHGDDDRVEILDGLSEGQTVVTSGQFLMDVESRTQEQIAKLRGAQDAK